MSDKPDRLLSENAVVEAIDRLYKQGDVFLTGSACRDTIIAVRALPSALSPPEGPT